MNRAELVEQIAKATNAPKAQADAFLRAFIDITEKSVKKGDSVAIVGFGTFAQTKKKARVARNPRTGEAIKVPAKKAPVFKAGKAFKDIVNGKAVEKAPAKAPAKTDKKTAKPAKADKKPAKPAKGKKK